MEPPHKRANTDKERCYRMIPVRDSSYQDHQCITDMHSFKSKLTLFDHHCITKWPIRTNDKKFRLEFILLKIPKGNQKEIGANWLFYVHFIIMWIEKCNQFLGRNLFLHEVYGCLNYLYHLFNTPMDGVQLMSCTIKGETWSFKL